jgi:hypothetical protein
MDLLEKAERRSKADKEQQFRRTVALQVYLPMVAAIGLLAALGSGLWTSGSGSASVWADISLIMLLLPLLLFILIAAAAVIALNVGLAKVFRWIRIGAFRVSGFVDRIGGAVKGAADGAVRPIIMAHGIRAVFESARQFLGSLFRAR